MENINKEIDNLLDKGHPIEWMFVIAKPNGVLKPVDPTTFKNCKGLKYKIAIIEKFNGSMPFMGR